MADSPESPPQSQLVSADTTVSASLLPPPSLGDSLVSGSVVEEGNIAALPRISSTASFAPEACHIEDIDSGCGHEHQKHSILHSANHTPNISRNASKVDVTHGSGLGGKLYDSNSLPEGDEDEGDNVGEGDEDDGMLEMKLPNSRGRLENAQLDPSIVAATQIDTATQKQANNPPSSPQLESPAQVAGFSMTEMSEHSSSPSAAITPEGALTVSNPPALTSTIEEGKAMETDSTPLSLIPGGPDDTTNINWEFDNMSELQAHITGPDPFEQLVAEAPSRSSTFPPVPPHDENSTTAHYENEKALFNMMASEVATGDGDRGMFDSPSAEHGGFFGAPEESAEDGFFNNISRGEMMDDNDNVAAMMGQVLDAAGIGGPALEATENVQNEEARFEEGMPLIDHDSERKQGEPSFFDEEVKVDEIFEVTKEDSDVEQDPALGLQRKSTEQVVGAVTHPYHSATGIAASMATVNSEVLSADDMEPKNDSLFSTLATTAEEFEDDFFGKIGQNPQPVTSQPPPAGQDEDEDDDLVARWKAALAGDVLDDEEGFLPSDDEGFLPDSDDEKEMASVHHADGSLQGFSSLSTGNPALAQTPSPVPSTTAGRYAPQIPQPPAQKVYGMAGWQPQVPQSQQALPNPYSPHPPVPTSTTQGYSASSPYNSFGQPPKVPEPPKAQSFVNKKEGYQSPYDLPMDVIPQVIRKRSNFGQAASGPEGFPPPSRSTSMGSAFSPATAAGPPKPKPQPQQFFEELPLPPKSRATSAMGYSSTQMLPRSAEGFVPLTGPQRSGSTQGFYSQSPQKQFAHPAMPSPQQVQAQPANAVNSRYSPAPRAAGGYVAPPASAPAAQGYQPPPVPVAGPSANVPYASPSAPPAALSKYPPRPAGPPQATSAAHSLQPSVRQQVTVPLQTSIPQPPGHDDAQLPALRRFPSDHHVMHSSRPGTARSISLSTTMDIPREEEEIVEDAPNAAENSTGPVSVPTAPNSRYAPPRGPGTPTPGQASRSSTFSPPSGSPRYIAGSPVDAFSPPPRAQTQSPGMAFGRSHKTAQRSREPYERPSSAFAHTSTHSHSSLNLHQRAQSLEVNFMAPTDETGRDMLKRWQGAPLFCWGFGGNVAVMFPRRAQRYSSDGLQPMIKCSPGEVKVKNIKDILPLKEIEGKFPGPAWSGSKNKGKKKEMLPWMTSKIEALESELGGQGKRAEEKILLWKVVRLLLEYDGVLEGNSEVEKAVRVVLTPEVLAEGESDANVGYGSFTMVGDISANTQGPSADRVDPEAVRSIKTNLLKGDRTAAVWHAADKRLWSHALLIAGTVGKDLWKQVVQEFVKHEVKTLGEGVESLAVLYEIFAGNWAESVDELVSASTRIGVPMYGGVPNGADDVEDKLDRWRETLGLVLNNRSPGDSEAILALGRLLVSYGRIEAGHICYIFARQGAMGGVGAIFGGHDDPVSHFSLLGVDPANFTPNDVDAVMLSEVYELALALTATPHPAFPHLLPYKLQRAMVRAENGNKSEAQKYVDAIEAAMRGWGKPSPYFNAGFIARFEDMKTRLSIAPKDNTPGSTTTGAGKWLPKLNSEVVATSIWEHFHTFVNGEKDGDGNGAEPSGTDPTAGPFGRISSESPVISRVQSSADLYGGYNPTPNYGASPPAPTNGFQQQQPYQPTAPTSGAGSKYAPQSRGSFDNPSNSYTPMSNHQYKSSTDSPGTGYGPSSSNGNSGGYGGYGEGYGGAYEPSVPSGNPYGSGGYSQPNLQQNNPYDSPQETSHSTTDYGNSSTYNRTSSFDGQTPTAPTASYDSPAAPETPSYGGYEPPSSGGYNPPSGGGYEPLSSGGYEPPSDGFVPFEPVKTDDDESHDKPKPKKKSFMDDDDDDELLKQAEKMKQEEAKKKAEEEKKQAADSSAKKGWLTGWFGGKKEQNTQGPIKAKLGDESSFVYDPDLKRWVNKKAGEQTPTAAKPAPPPKRTSTPGSTGMPSRPGSAAPPLSPQVPTPAMTPISPTPTTAPTTPTTLSAPPAPFGRTQSPAMSAGQASPSLSSPPLTGGPPIGGPPMGGSPMGGSPRGALTGGPPGGPPGGKPPGAGPPSRPATSMSVRGGDAMDDLLGPPGANVSRKSTPGVGRKARGKNRYVEVIPGQQ